MRSAFSGVAISKGLALGRARVRAPHIADLEDKPLPPEDIDAEIERLAAALATTRAELAKLREQLQYALAQEQLGEFIDLHALILDDPDLVTSLNDLIRSGPYRAETALRLQRDRLAAIFDAMDDPYMKSRREDMEHAIARVRHVLQRGSSADVVGLAGDVLVTDLIAPAEIAQLSERGVVAAIVTHGSVLSHSAILARGLGLPILVLPREAAVQITDGSPLMVDANHGEAILEPAPDDLRHYRKLEQEQAREKRTLAKLRHAPSRTIDEVDIRLMANAESREDLTRAVRLGADGVGLYRTEFLFLNRRDTPDEEEQFAAYRDLVLAMNRKPVTLRTIDIGSDKIDSAGIALQKEPNPALGLRGLRLALARPALFRTQLRAMLRASAYGPVRVLLPMLTWREEMLKIRALFEGYKTELRAEGHAVAENVELGAMIEVPAAALALPSIIDTVDFVSIGTNDLIQYLLAVDRGNDAVGDLLSPLHPAVLRVLHDILAIGRKHRKSVSICGEMAGQVRYTKLLLALGLTEFSMSPSSLLEARSAIRESQYSHLRRRAGNLLKLRDRAALEKAVARL
mgnify:CR=1 FL=1